MYVPKKKEDDIRQVTRLRDELEEFEGIIEKNDEEAPEFLKTKSNVMLLDQASNSFTEKARLLVQRLISAQNPNIIDRESMIYVAEKQRERFFGCLSLPFSFFMFLAFAVSTFLHEDITNVYFIESGLRSQLGGGHDEVGSISGCWQWIEDLVPKVFIQTNQFGDPETDKTYWNRVLMFNQLTGPLILEQTRSEKELCFDGDGIFGDMLCYPKDTESDEPIPLKASATDALIPAPGELLPTGFTSDYPGSYPATNFSKAQRKTYWTSAFSVTVQDDRRLRGMRVEYMGKLPGADDSDKKFVVRMFPQTHMAITKKQVEYLKAGGWLDPQTKQVKLKALLLNAEVGRPRLEQLNIIFRFSRGGGVFSRLTLDSMFLKMWDGGRSMAADAIFIIMLLVVTIIEVMEGIKQGREKQFKKHLRKPWTILEFLIVFLGWLVWIGYAYQNSLRAQVVDDLKAVRDTTVADIPPESISGGDDLHSSADEMASFSGWFRILQAEYHLILMFRFFTAFAAQPRLGVVTSTLEHCIVDIIHFLIVLLPTFMAYAISGVFVFGRRLEEFSTFDAAIGICFKMAMEGEYDWDLLSKRDYWTAALWTWTFMILLVLLMISMVLAIVMDVYTAKRKAAGQSETIGVTIWNILTRIRNSRVWVSNKDLIEVGKGMERLVSRENLLAKFPGMCDQQLDAFILAVKYQTELDSAAGMDLTDSMKMTMAVKLSIDKLNDDLKALQDGAFAGVEKDKGEPWLTSLAKQMAANSHWMLGIQWQLQQLSWQWAAMEAAHGEDVIFEPGSAPLDGDDIVL